MIGMNHILKTDKLIFQPVVDGFVKFNIRYNDRGFSVGDTLVLKETSFSGEEMRNGSPLSFTGRELSKVVTHVLSGPIYGLSDGWCILSFS